MFVPIVALFAIFVMGALAGLIVGCVALTENKNNSNTLSGLTSKINNLESEVSLLESKIVPVVPVVPSSINNYSGFGNVECTANHDPTNMLNMQQSIGSTTLGNLPAGSLVVVKIIGTAQTGDGVTLTITLYINGNSIVAPSILIEDSGALEVEFVLSVRDTEAFAYTTIVYGSTVVTSSSGPFAFNRLGDHDFSTFDTWTDSESGGQANLFAAFIETKFLF